jgi:outer membrane phospholipase A
MGLAIKDWLKQRDKDYADKHPSINDYHGYHTRRFEAMTDETVMFIVGDGHDQEAGFTLREIYYYHPERIKNTFDYDDDIDDQVRESMKELLNCSDAGELLFGW